MKNNQNSNEEKPIVKKDRIISIDFFKGISIIVMICGHVMNFWVVSSGIWMYSIMYLYYCSILTSVNFVMLSGMTLPISYFSKLGIGWSLKRTRIHILKRTGVLLIIAIIYNVIIESILGIFVWNNLFSYYSWYVIQLIAISLILTLFLLKLNKYIRLGIGVIFILIATPFYYWLLSLGTPIADILCYILFNPFKDFPFFPWVGLVIIGSVIGEFLFNIYKNPPDIKMKKLKNFMIYLLIIGIALLLFGLFSGLRLPPASDGFWYSYAVESALNLSTNPYLTYYSLPYFMLVGHWTYMFYGLGGLFIIFAGVIWLVDYKKYKNKLFTSFKFTGIFAFSIFIYHHIGIPFLVGRIPVFWIWPVSVGYTILVPFLVWLDVKYLKGIPTLEWLMALVTTIHLSKKKN
ncbi:MAG: heparan-alpha-glucosaminide N-acetyltransferase domain-containing protein [Candidatus Helarchaeota archaeon]